MPRDALRETLDELHRELEKSDELDDDNRAQLARAATEIRQRLDAEEPPEEEHSLGEQLEDAALAFEVSHPSLAELVRRVVVSLGATGI